MEQNKDQIGAAVRGEAVAHPAWKRMILYTDTIKGQQTCRDDLWAITTTELTKFEQASVPIALLREALKNAEAGMGSTGRHYRGDELGHAIGEIINRASDKVSIRAADAPSEPSESAMRAALERIARWHGEFPDVGSWPDGTKKSYGGAFGSNGEREYMRGIAHDALLGQPVDTKSGQREPQQKTIDCMDAWATSMQMPTYSELHALTEEYDSLIRKICFQYAAGGYNSEGFMAPKSADLKLRWIIDEAYKSPSRAADAPSEPSEQALWDDNGEPMNDAAENEWRQCNERIRQRAADALDSQPTVLAYVATDLDGRADVGMTPEKAMERAGHGCDTIIPVYDLASSQPTDGGVRNG